jgi:hypothetical protein
MLLPDCILDGKPQRIAPAGHGHQHRHVGQLQAHGRGPGALDFFAASDFFHNPATLHGRHRAAGRHQPGAPGADRLSRLRLPGRAALPPRRWSSPRRGASGRRDVPDLGVRLGMARAVLERRPGGLLGARPPRASPRTSARRSTTTPTASRSMPRRSTTWSITATWTPTASTGCAASDRERQGRVRRRGAARRRPRRPADLSRARREPGLDPGGRRKDYPLVLTSGARTKFTPIPSTSTWSACARRCPTRWWRSTRDDAAPRGIADGDPVRGALAARRRAVRAKVTDASSPAWSTAPTAGTTPTSTN